MRIIKSYSDLLAEKDELTSQLALQKAFIRQDLKGLQEELKPVTKVVSFLGKMTTRDASNPAVTVGLDIAGDVLIKNTLLKRGGWLSRLIVPFLFKNLSSHLISKRRPAVNGGFLSNLVGKLKPN